MIPLGVEQACAAFHAAQDSIIALTQGRDEIDVSGLPELRARRDAAFQDVRGQVARTSSALQAKVRVLIAMRDWFAVENPDVSAFAIDVAIEAAELLDSNARQACLWHETQSEDLEHQSRGTERRNPFS